MKTLLLNKKVNCSDAIYFYLKRILLIFLGLFFVLSSYSANISSNAVTGNWNSTSTWSGGTIPGSADNVTIVSGANVTVNVAEACTSITIAGTLTGASGVTLTVGGGAFTDNGTFTNGGGTVSFTGASSIAGSATPTFANLTITSGTLSSSINFGVNGTWTNSGTFSPGTSTQTVIFGTGGIIASNTTFRCITINTTNSTDVVSQTASSITLQNNSGTGTLTLTKGIFKIGNGNTFNMSHNGGSLAIVATNGSLATTGTNGSDGGTVYFTDQGTTTFTAPASSTNLTFYNVTFASNLQLAITNSSSVIVNGTFKLSNNQRSWTGTNGIIYGNNSVSGLYVNYSGQTYNPTTNEWKTMTSGTLGTTEGYPNNVTLVNCASNNAITGDRAIAGTFYCGDGTTAGSIDISGTTSFVCGGVTINNSSSLKSRSAAITVKGNWLRQGSTIGTFNANSGTVIFGGSGTSGSPQTIGLSTGTESSFYNITINNGTYVSLNSPVTLPAAGVLTLTSGILQTTTTNILSVTNTATSAITGTGSATNMINGPVKWSLLNSGTNTYTFPIGAGTTYLPLILSSKNTLASNVATAQAFAANSGGTADGSTLSAISSTEYWSFSTSGALTTTGSTLNITRPTAITPYTIFATSGSQTGTYSALAGSSTTYGATSGDLGTGTQTRYCTFGQAPTANVALANNTNGQVASGNLALSSTNNVIYNFQTAVTTASATLNSVSFTTAGSATSSDITNFKLYYTTTSTFATTNLLGTVSSSTGAGLHSFTGLSQTVSSGSTGYFWITADITSGATAGDAVNVSALTSSNLTYSSTPNFSGTPSAGGTQTIIALPSATTSAASSITTTGATLNGTINTNGISCSTYFNYGLTTSYSNTNVAATPSTITSGSSAISLAVTGLTPNTLYNFQSRATNVNGTGNGSNLTFTTLSNAPTVGTPTTPTSTGFTANWTAPTGQGSEAYTYTVQASTDVNFGSVAASQAGIASGTLTYTFTTLSSATTYYFRVMAVNAGGNSAYSSASTAIITGDADSDGSAPAVGNNINSLYNQYLIESAQRSTYLYDATGTSGAYLTYDNGTPTPAANTKYAWYITNNGSGEYSIQNVSTGNYIVTQSTNYIGNVGDGCATENTNRVDLVNQTTFTGLANNIKYWNFYIQSGTAFQTGAVYQLDDDYIFSSWGYYLNTAYSPSSSYQVLISAANCNSTRNFGLTTYTATPDLQVTNVTTDVVASSLELGTSFNATATIINNGLDPIASGTAIKVKFVFNGKIFTTSYTAGLAAGASVTLPAVAVTPNQLTAGSALVVTVNSNWAVAEYNYSNNTYTTSNIAVVPATFKPSVGSTAATSITTTSVTMNGTVNAKGYSTVVTFNYGITTGYGSTQTATQSPVTGSVVTPVSASLTGLTPNTLYHYDITGVNSQGTNTSGDQSFTTLSNAATIGTATSITTTGFTANWTAPTGQGSEAYTYSIDISTDNTFTTGVTTVISSSASYAFTGLSSGTLYYYRVKVVNAGGSSAYSATSAGVTTSFTVGSACSGTGTTGASGSPAVFVDAASAPTIDGTVDAIWSKAPVYQITKSLIGTIQTGSTWQAMYDATNLYILVQVKDANLYIGTDYNYDAVEIYVAADGSTTHQTRFNYGQTTTPTGTNQWTTGVSYAIPSVAGGYNLEVSIPWTTIGMTPANAASIRFDINIDDNQSGSGRTAQAGWYSSDVNEYSTPSDYGYGSLTVCGAPTLASPTATNITNATATLGATVTVINGGTLTAAGVAYNTATGVTNQNATAITGTPTLNTPFTTTVTGLSPQTKYFYVGYANRTNFSTVISGVSGEGNFYTLSNPATAQPSSFTATNGDASAILNWTSATFPVTGASATGYIILRRQDGSNPSSTGIVNATSAASLSLPSGTTLVTTVTSGSTLTYSDSGLSDGTTYNYLIVPFTWDGTNNATINYYTTGAKTTTAIAAALPSLDTPTVSNITNNSATLGANISSNGGASLSARGTVYKTSTGVSATDNPQVASGTSTGVFTDSRTGLSAQTLYYYKGYATNSTGTGLSSQGSFYTLSNPATAASTTFTAEGVNNAINLTLSGATFPVSGATQAGYLLVYSIGGTPSLIGSPNGKSPINVVSNGTVVSTTEGTLPIQPSIPSSLTGLSGSISLLVVPYTWDGVNTSTYNYYVAGEKTASLETVTGISLDNSSISILEGNTQALTATITPGGATNKTVIWTSSDETVATVSATGVVTGTGLGIATITATTQDGGYIANCSVTVNSNCSTGVAKVNGICYSTLQAAIDSPDAATYPILLQKDIPSQNVTITTPVTLVPNLIAYQIGNLTIAPTGSVTVNGTTLLVQDLILQTNTTDAAQLKKIGAADIEIGGDLYLDKTISTTTPLPGKWYSFSVPFAVNPVSGIFLPSGTKLTLGNQYNLRYYNGQTRADYGVVNVDSPNNAWQLPTSLVSGQGYMITTAGYKTIRLKAIDKNSLSFINTQDIDLTYYQTTTAEDAYQEGWNFCAQPLLTNATLSGITGYAQVLRGGNALDNDKYDVIAFDGTTVFAPYIGFFYQTPVTTSGTFNTSTNNATLRAIGVQTNVPYNLLLTRNATLDYDRMYFTTNANASNAYEIGKDVEKMQVTTGYPQIWSEAFGIKLAAIDVPILNDSSSISLGIQFPASGSYTIGLSQQNSQGIVWLLKNNIPLHNLTESDYTFDTNAQTTEVYSLKIISPSSAITTGTISNQVDGVNIYVVDGIVHIVGLKEGETYAVYTTVGVLLANGKGTGQMISLPLTRENIYLVVLNGNKTIKVLNE